MSRWWPLAVAVLLVGAAAAYGHNRDRHAALWEQRAVVSAERALEARQEADSVLRVADSLAASADSLAEVAHERGQRVRARVVEVREAAVPDTCAPFVGPRDAIIDTLVVESDTWREAFQTQTRSAVALRLALDIERAAGDSLLAVIEDRPRPRPWWVPEVGAGLFAGICLSGRACVGVGATLSWRVR